MTPLTLEAARALLGDAYGITKADPLLPCRVNFFEPAVLALSPTGLALVRQDMLGRRHTHQFPRETINDFAVVSTRRRQTALRFAVGEVVWQLDGLGEEDFPEVIRHLHGASASLEDVEEIEEIEEIEEVEELDLEPDPVDENATASGSIGSTSAQRGTGSPASATAVAGEPRPPARRSVQGAPLRTPVDEVLILLDDAIVTDPSPDHLSVLLQRLFVQCLALGQMDRALLTAQCLLALDQAGPPERELAARYHTDRVLEAEAALGPAHWEALGGLAPADRALEAVATALGPALVRMTARTRREYGLKGPPEGSQHLLFGRVFGYVRRFCANPDIYYHPMPDGPRGIAFANLVQEGAWAPALVVGADYLAGRTETQLAFRIGHELSFLRREHLLRVLLPSLGQQALLVLTAVALAVPDRPIPGEDEKAVRAQRSALTKHMEIEDFERLTVAVKRLLAQTEPFDLLRWNRGVERCALRVGLLVAGDAAVACTSVSAVIPNPADLDRARAELIRFAVGNLHQRLRQELRLAVA